MFQDNLLFTISQEKVADSIATAFKEGLCIYKGIVITIFGIAGTGKSEVAWWLARKLYKQNFSSHILSLDRFYRIPIEDRDEHRKQTDIIGPEEMDWDSINKEIDLFYSLENINVLIVEGLYAGFLKDSNLKVFLDGTIEDTYRFRKIRGKEDPTDKFRQYVVEKEFAVVIKSRESAEEIYNAL